MGIIEIHKGILNENVPVMTKKDLFHPDKQVKAQFAVFLLFTSSERGFIRVKHVSFLFLPLCWLMDEYDN